MSQLVSNLLPRELIEGNGVVVCDTCTKQRDAAYAAELQAVSEVTVVTSPYISPQSPTHSLPPQQPQRTPSGSWRAREIFRTGGVAGWRLPLYNGQEAGAFLSGAPS
jgi:hypothetical protein